MKGFFTDSTTRKAAPTSMVPKCGSCGLYRRCESPKMAPYGKGERDVLIVGEAPGETEDLQGRPFVGKAGDFLRESMEQIGVDLDRDAVTTNALICRPPGNETPSPKQIDYCRPNLLSAIQSVRPRVIITLGRSALQSLMEPYWKSDLGPLERWVGWKIPLRDHWICPTYHPSYLLRSHNPMLDKIFCKHLKSAFRLRKNPSAGVRDPKIQILFEAEEIAESLVEMERSEWVAFDYECNCLKPEYPEARIVSCAVSNGESTISYPFAPGWIKEFTGRFLKSKARKIAANLKFEERWTIKEYGHGVRNWGWDTMLAAHCIDNRPGICSLKFQAFVKLGVPSYNEHIEPYLANRGGYYNRIHHVDVNDLLYYGGMDALLEYRLAEIQMRDLKAV